MMKVFLFFKFSPMFCHNFLFCILRNFKNLSLRDFSLVKIKFSFLRNTEILCIPYFPYFGYFIRTIFLNTCIILKY